MKKKKYILVILAVVLAIAMAISVYAAWGVSSWTINQISTPSFGISIEEKYDAPEEGVSPGVDITKEVNIKNTGETDSLIRVKLTKAFGKRGENGEFKEDVMFSPEYIELDINENAWSYRKTDGWYYYQGVLKPGETTSEPLLNGFRVSEDVGNEYQEQDARITVMAESIQYEGNAAEEIWGLSYADLQVEAPKIEENDRVTTVTYIDDVQKFDIETSKTDLFANFKNLLPGTGRSQKILVKNAYEGQTVIRLICMEEENDSKDEYMAEKIHKMLTKYVMIDIRDKQGKIVYTGPVGGKGDCNIDLGTFEGGETKELKVSLYVDETMTSEYQDLLGKVRWVFEADGTAQTEIVKTGDTGRILLYMFIFLASAGVLAMFLRWRRCRR